MPSPPLDLFERGDVARLVLTLGGEAGLLLEADDEGKDATKHVTRPQSPQPRARREQAGVGACERSPVVPLSGGTADALPSTPRRRRGRLLWRCQRRRRRSRSLRSL